MPKFRFKLDALKKYRERRLLVAKKDMMEVESRRMQVVEKSNLATQERSSALGFDPADVKMLPLLGMLVTGQNQKIEQFQKQLEEIDKELERHRSWVAHLSKELKAVEKLEEKKRQAFDEDMKKLERRFQDAWVVERWGISRDPDNSPEVEEGDTP